MAFKNATVYRELRQAYRAMTIYHKLWPYVVNRWWVAPKLPRLDRPLDRAVDTQRYTIHLMCGQRDFLALVWSLGSWYAAAADCAAAIIHDDGTLRGDQRAALARLFPNTVRVIDAREATQQAATEWLFDAPTLRGYRSNADNVYAIKLVDPYFTSTTPGVLVMDTDVLWFGRPEALHAAIRDYRAAVFWPSSGKPQRQPFRDGSELRLDLAALNSGLVYYEKSGFDIGLLDAFCRKLAAGATLFDQPAYAYALGKHGPVTTLPVEAYHIHHAAHAGTIGKHYTGPRREQFWFEGVERLKSRLLE
jgi:hypothetical protein